MTVSHHMLRRRARAREQVLEAHKPADARYRYQVVKTRKGPWRYRVEQIPYAR